MWGSRRLLTCTCGHRATKHYIPWPIPCAGAGEDEAAAGDRATRTWISVDRLKPHIGAPAPVVAQPPTIGCPLQAFVLFIICLVLSSTRVKLGGIM